MTFIVESWFWRGTQSAIFYYISCAPCMDYRHKRKRRKEGIRVEKARAEVVSTQPGIIPQPGPFQTNEAWGEEMVLGPGPPKGWKSDKIIQKMKQKMHNEGGNPQSDEADPFQNSVKGLSQEQASLLQTLSTGRVADTAHTETREKALRDRPADSEKPRVAVGDNGETVSAEFPRVDSTPARRPSAYQASVTPASTPSTSPEPTKSRRSSTDSRPMGMRKMSNTFVAVKDTLRSSLHPEKWNWKRYEREDEILSGFNGRINRLWDRAIRHNSSAEMGDQPSQPTGRKRAATNDSEQYDYNRARNPAINDLHPPVVSQLPATREGAAWMLMAPPSRAVMEGKQKPNAEATMRWPLARIGTTKEEQALKRLARENELVRVDSARASSKGKERAMSTPDDPYAASDESSNFEHEEGSLESPNKENIPFPPSTSFPFPTQQEDSLRPPAKAHLYSEARKSWSDSSPPLLVTGGDGTHSPSHRWSYSGIWVT